MAAERPPELGSPFEVDYNPERLHPLLPVEVLDRSDLVGRLSHREASYRQRASFHQLIVCTAGQGSHEVDFEPLKLNRGTVLRIYPGQVQQFVPDPVFEARMVVWPRESHHPDPALPAWYPGSDTPTRWDVDDVQLNRTLGWIEELADEQNRFDGSQHRVGLQLALLCCLLLRIGIELPHGHVEVNNLPKPYLDFRALVEDRLYQRPSIGSLARELGYSTRTLDRACDQVSGQTAKKVLDQRVALEVRRLLTHSRAPISQIAVNLGFGDPSNFSKFVKKHLGDAPNALRAEAAGPGDRTHIRFA